MFVTGLHEFQNKWTLSCLKGSNDIKMNILKKILSCLYSVCQNFSKNSKEAIQSKMSKSIPPKNAALHLKHVQLDHKYPSNVSPTKFVKWNFNKDKTIKILILVLKDWNYCLNMMKTQS